MKLKLNRNLQLGYGFSILILIVIGVFSYVAVHNLLASNKAVDHSNLVMQKLEKTMSIMKDAETGERGFLLTNKATFLAPYNGSYQKAVELVNDVKILTTDNAIQQGNVAEIRSVLVKRLNILNGLVNKRRRGEPVTLNDFESGKSAMDALRQAIDKTEKEEQFLLEQRIAVLNRYVVITPVIILFGVFVAVCIAVFSYLSVTRDIAEKDRLRDELQLSEQETAAINEELRAANEEITASNEELSVINEELSEARDELATLNESLEDKVNQRTSELMESEAEAQALNEELKATNEELAAANEEMQATNEELNNNREELQRSEKLFRSIAVNIPKSLVIVIGQDRRFMAVEGDLMKQMGYDSRNYTGKHPAEVGPPERYEATKHLYDRVLAGVQFREERKGANGADFQVDFVPLRDDAGAVYAGLIIALDITEIKKAEERSAKLAAIVQSSDDAIMGKTLEGKITSWNPAAERMFGYSEAEIIGESILKIIPEDRQDEEPQIIAQLKAGQHFEHFETKRITSDGRILDVSLSISLVRDAQGNITGVSKIARDISEKKQDELRKNDFIGMVSHELKTPLTTLSAIVQIANAKLKNSEDAFLSGAMERANTQAKKMSTMINGFLNLSRLESGKMLIDKHVFNLDDLITETVEEARLTAATHEILFKGGPAVMINADYDKIGSVISNLLSNAVKYSPRGKTIEIRPEVFEDKVVVSVKDEGMGIKPQDRNKLFDRYYRVESNHTRHISGFGIGLYLSAEIVHHHNGEIWVESDSEKETGSTFYFSLPLTTTQNPGLNGSQ